MAFAQLSKVRLEYFEHGHGPSRVVFIHGFQASGRIWGAVQAALPADRYASIAINNRGAGASDAPPNEADFSIQAFADDAFELVSQLGWDNFTLVGHSMGGATAARFAVDHPKVLNGLVLLDPADPDGRTVPPTGPGMDAIIDSAMAALRAGQSRPADGPPPPNENLRLLAEDIRAAPERRLRGSLRSMFDVRIGDRLRALPIPTLLVAGDADELIPIANMLATWAKLPPGAGLHVWHGVGHSPNLERPEELAQLLQSFVERTIPATRERQGTAAARV